MADYKDLQDAKRPAQPSERQTLIDWGRVGDALRGGTRRVTDAAIDAAFDRDEPAAPIIVDRGPVYAPTDNTALYVILGLGVLGLAYAARK